MMEEVTMGDLEEAEKTAEKEADGNQSNPKPEVPGADVKSGHENQK